MEAGLVCFVVVAIVQRCLSRGEAPNRTDLLDPSAIRKAAVFLGNVSVSLACSHSVRADLLLD